MNKDLITGLYSVYSPSGKEKPMRKFIKKYIKKNIPGVKWDTDGAGNLLITKGDSETYPCICSHMDQVSNHIHPGDFKVGSDGKNLFAISLEKGSFCGIGADDKNGIYVALECLKKYDVLKCAFFVSEEIGCVGSRSVDFKFFDDCRFVLQVDRRGNSDLITSISGEICSEEFVKDINPEKWGYKSTEGMTTDVEELKQRGLGISCVNMSCGYYRPHTNEEYTNIEDLEKCLRFVEHIIEDCTKVYPHEAQVLGYSDWYDDELTLGSRAKKKATTHAFYYGDDWDTMYQILSIWNMMSFEDIMRDYADFFVSNKDNLQYIYDEVLDTVMSENEYYDENALNPS